jgi:hypothetical protein
LREAANTPPIPLAAGMLLANPGVSVAISHCCTAMLSRLRKSDAPLWRAQPNRSVYERRLIL